MNRSFAGRGILTCAVIGLCKGHRFDEARTEPVSSMQAKDIWFRRDVLCAYQLSLSKARVTVDGKDEGWDFSGFMEE